MADGTVSNSNNFYALYNTLSDATERGQRVQVEEKGGRAVWNTQNAHLRRFLNVVTLSLYGRYQDKQVAKSLSQAIDQHLEHHNAAAPDHNEETQHLAVFKTQLEALSSRGLVTGNFVAKLNAQLTASATGSTALKWVKQRDLTNLIPPSSKLPYRQEGSIQARVDAIKDFVNGAVRNEVAEGAQLNSAQLQAVNDTVSRLGEQVVAYLQQRDQVTSPAELAKQVSTAIANDIKQHLDTGYGPEQAAVAWAVGEKLGVLLGEVEADVPGKQPAAIHVSEPVTEPSSQQPPSPQPSSVIPPTGLASVSERAVQHVDRLSESVTPVSQPRPVTPLEQGVRGIFSRPDALSRPSGAKVDYFDTPRETELLKRLTPFEINRGRLEQVLADPNWIERETGALFSETEQAKGRRAQQRLERYTAFGQLSQKKQQAIFEKLEKRVHEAQIQDPGQKLDADWFANQLRSSTEKVLEKRYVGVAKGGKKFKPAKDETVQYKARQTAKLHLQGARTTVNQNILLTERGPLTRLAEGVDSVVERLQGHGQSAIGFSSTPQTSKIDDWIATANFRPLREIELDAFAKQYKQRVTAFAEVNQHWPREQDWQRLAIDTVRDLRNRQQW